MSNTVTSISYANTFGEWVIATNGLINENNVLAAGDYTKSSGTLYLNETTKNSLQANGTVVVQKELRVQGIASSATVDNNLTVGGQIYFSNTVLGLTNYGQANINGLLVAQGPGTGLSVANNTYIGGNTTIQYTTITDTVQANTLVNTAISSVTGTTYTNKLQANTSVLTGSVQANSSILTDVIQANTSVITGTIQANNSVNTAIASVTGATYSDKVQANTSILTGIIQANNSIVTGTLKANTSVLTDALQSNTSIVTSVLKSNTSILTDALQSNTSVVTGSLKANNSSLTDIIQANTSILTGAIQANTSVLTGVVQANSSVLTGIIQANTSVNTAIASVTGTTYTNILQANNSIVSNTFTANTSATIPTLTVNTKLDGNSAAGFFNSLQVQGGGLTVAGNFTLAGTTVYASNTFQLSTGTSSGITSYLQVARGSSGANAAFRWNEPLLYWETLDVTSNIYSRVITENYLAIQSGSYANSAFIKANSAYEQANSASLYANGAFVQANSAYNSQNTSGSYANSSFIKANSAYAQANSASLFANGAFIQANAAYTRANNSLNANTGGVVTGDVTVTGNLTVSGTTTYINTNIVATQDSLIKLANNNTSGDVLDIGFYGQYLSGSVNYTGLVRQAGSNNYLLFKGLSQDPTSNTLSPGSATAANVATLIANVSGYSITSNGVDLYLYTTNAFTQANTATNNAAGASLYANGAFVQANAAYNSQNTTGSYANSAYTQANTATTNALAASSYANTGLAFANSAGSYANSAFVKANSAYNAANLSTNYIVGTTGTIAPSSGYISFSSNNGVTVVATTANNLAVSTSQDLRTTASPTFVGGTFSQPVIATTMAPGTSNTALATTAYVQNLTNNSGTLTTSITGNAGTVTNGVYTNGSYSDPSWILSLAAAKVGVGTANNVQHNSLGIGTGASGTAGEIRATNNITAYYSDDRLKTRIGTIENALDKLCSLTGFYYEANETAQALGYKVKKEVGVSAQEVQKVLPEIVVPAPIDEQYLTVHYEKLLPLVIEAIKELKKEIDDLKGN